LFEGQAWAQTATERVHPNNENARYGDVEADDLMAELGAALPHFVYWLLTRVGLIEISTDNDSYACAIFETSERPG